MSRVQFVRQMLPRICKDFYELEIYHNPTGAATFDPSLTTSVSTTVIWQTEAGTTVTTGTSHALSYTPTAGAKVCTVTVLAGLRAVTGIDCQSDLISRIKNYEKLVNCVAFSVFSNALLSIDVSKICGNATTIYISGTASPGPLSAIRSNVIITLVASSNSALIGALSDLKATLQTAWLQLDSNILPETISHLVAIRDLRVYSMGWNAAGVDTVLLSASDAVWADAAHYTYIAPALQIQTNAVPGGSAGADTTDPMTTPGSGNSNTDWEWDAGKGAHKALTGKAAIYFLSHNTGHAWIITYQTV